MKFPDQKRIILIAIVIAVIFILGLMLKFWLYTIVILIAFAAGYIIGDRSDDKSDRFRRYD